MDETLKLLSDRHIPVYLSNLVSNEKDLKPFISIEPENNAASQYSLGRLAYEHGDSMQARAYFSKAIDLDGLRFRAPATINDIIARLCSKYPDAHLVDTHAEFADRSAGHLIGNELLLEHVHPNLTGYALLSDAFYRELKRTHFFSIGGGSAGGGSAGGGSIGGGSVGGKQDTAAEITLQELMKDMPLTTLDSLSAAFKIERLRRNWPFNEGSPQDSLPVASNEQKLAYEVAFGRMRWQTAMDSLYEQYMATDDLVRARTIMKAMTLEHPKDAFYFERAANISGKLEDLQQAAFYFRQAFELEPSFERARHAVRPLSRIRPPGRSNALYRLCSQEHTRPSDDDGQALYRPGDPPGIHCIDQPAAQDLSRQHHRQPLYYHGQSGRCMCPPRKDIEKGSPQPKCPCLAEPVKCRKPKNAPTLSWATKYSPLLSR